MLPRFWPNVASTGFRSSEFSVLLIISMRFSSLASSRTLALTFAITRDTRSMNTSTPALNCSSCSTYARWQRTQVDLGSEIRHGEIDLAHVDSGVQIDIRLRNGGGGGEEGEVNHRVRVAGEGVTSVAGGCERLYVNECDDEENDEDKTVEKR
jgi:hypothetical protein